MQLTIISDQLSHLVQGTQSLVDAPQKIDLIRMLAHYFSFVCYSQPNVINMTQDNLI